MPSSQIMEFKNLQKDSDMIMCGITQLVEVFYRNVGINAYSFWDCPIIY